MFSLVAGNRRRPLLGRLCQMAYRTAREMISAASPNGEPLVPGMIAVLQTFGDDLGWYPHVHARVTRGGWEARGGWVGVPFVDGDAAALVVHHRLMTATASNASPALCCARQRASSA